MCEMCTELDERIADYMRFAAAVTDGLPLKAIAELVAELREEKAALHA
jgi:hypothetical protein